MVRLGQNFLADPNLLEAIVRDAAVKADDVVLEIGDSGYRCRDLYPVIHCSQPPTVCAASGTTSYTETVRVHLRSRLQVIECANAVPGFDSGGRITARVPPPHTFPVDAVV